MIKITVPRHIERVLRRFTENGYEAYLVGGGVRDTLMGRPVRDWDIASAALTHEVARIFEKTVMTGERFGTVTIILPECIIEATTFRTDGVYRDGRRPDNVSFETGLLSDLGRRDFTMNAMAASEHGLITDPFDGISDIKAHIIRCVGNPEMRFREDALRMFRALRFSAELDFTIEPETLSAISSLAPEAERLSAERVSCEIEKILMSKKPEVLCNVHAAGLLRGRISGSGAVLQSISSIKTLPPDRTLRWCAFLAVLKNARLIGSVTDFASIKLRLDGKTVKCCSVGTDIALSGFPCDSPGIKRLLSRHSVTSVLSAAAAHEILYGGTGALLLVESVLTGGECYSSGKLAVSGRDLINAGFVPGKKLGRVLDMLLDHVIEHPEDNTSDILLELALNAD